MLNYPPPRFEQQKSEMLQRYRILRDTGVHDAGQITGTISLVFDMPVVLVSLNERYRSWYKASHGAAPARLAGLQAVCALANLAEDAFFIRDCREEAYFAREPAVTRTSGAVFLAGAPLSDPQGKRFGTLCLIDTKPRDLTPAQMQMLNSFALLVSQDICLRSAGRYAVRDLIEAEQEKCELYDLAVTDPLTKALNRRAFFRFAEREVTRASRHGTPLSAILFDIDHFKPVNDIHGHGIGDEVLVRLTRLMMENIRDEDLLGRLGGEEFALILPQTGPDAAHALANRLREKVRALRFESPEGTFGITVSLGVSAPDAEERDILSALARADKALYRAKRLGRDRVELNLPGGSNQAEIIPLPLPGRANGGL